VASGFIIFVQNVANINIILKLTQKSLRVIGVGNHLLKNYRIVKPKEYFVHENAWVSGNLNML